MNSAETVGILREFFRLHQQKRRAQGLAALIRTEEVNRAARKHARWMARTGNLDHVGKGGSTHIDRLRDEGYEVGACSENIAWGYESAESVFAGWMGTEENHTGHRDNILNPFWRHIGLGVAEGRDGRNWWCVVFAAPAAGMPRVFIASAVDPPPGLREDA